MNEHFSIDSPQPGKWRCYLIGRPGERGCVIWHPSEDTTIPNFFWRFMQWCMFGVIWMKDKE